MPADENGFGVSCGFDPQRRFCEGSVVPSTAPKQLLNVLYPGLVGLFLALSLIKWGNPVTMDGQIASPSSYFEVILAPWPIAWGYAMFSILLFFLIPYFRPSTGLPTWWVWLPLVWFGWQLIASLFTIDSTLTLVVIPHFAVAVVMFYVGLFSFSKFTRLFPFWTALMGGFLFVLLIGLKQHFGGLEQTREFLYSFQDWRSLPSEFLDKVSSNRIYSTFVYPNAFAGEIVLLTPIALALVAGIPRATLPFVRLLALFGVGALCSSCMYWSGSKAGWLIAMFQGLTFIAHSKSARSLRLAGVVGILVVGTIGFALKYQDYLYRGATSVSARVGYWKVSWITLRGFPIVGSGPGTFEVCYRKLKSPEAEMTRLAHNDYLQQASDSGIVGGLTYLAFWIGGLALLYRNSKADQLSFSVFVGLFGLAVQGFFEFGFYIPAICWPSWFLLGWFVSRANRFDNLNVYS